MKTAVEYLIDKFDTILPLDFNWDKLEKVFEQAKALEKEQIIDAYEDCSTNELGEFLTGKQYYNETFKSE